MPNVEDRIAEWVSDYEAALRIAVQEQQNANPGAELTWAHVDQAGADVCSDDEWWPNYPVGAGEETRDKSQRQES